MRRGFGDPLSDWYQRVHAIRCHGPLWVPRAPEAKEAPEPYMTRPRLWRVKLGTELSPGLSILNQELFVHDCNGLISVPSSVHLLRTHRFPWAAFRGTYRART